MKTSALGIVSAAILLVAADVSIGIAKKNVVQRPVEDAFVDSFFLDEPPIRAQMPGNWSDAESNLLAGIRVDNLDYVAGMGTFTDLDEMLMAFYENQQAFNGDPDRNRIRMHGSIKEIVEDDGTVVAMIDIAYRDLPLTVYTLDSWDRAIFEDLDLAGLVKVVENGTMVGRFSVEMEIPFPGAPLHYWDAVFSGTVRRQSFVGHGSGWQAGESGEWEPVQVHIIQTEREGEFLSEIVRIVPGFQD